MPADVSSIAISLVTLTALEIVLGIDNVIFISVLSGRLPQQEREKGRKTGLSVALVTRIMLLLSLNWIMSLNTTLFTIVNIPITGRSVILLGGGLFLIYKSTREIYAKVESHEEDSPDSKGKSFWSIVGQIALIDIIFSFDSVITAVGMANQIGVMIAAVVIALAIMMFFSGYVADFIEKHPSIKVLALSFLILIGANLVAEALGQHPEKGFTYFAMAFATAVELLNLRMRNKLKKKDTSGH